MNENFFSLYEIYSFIENSSKHGNLAEIHSSKFSKENSMNENSRSRRRQSWTCNKRRH